MKTASKKVRRFLKECFLFEILECSHQKPLGFFKDLLPVWYTQVEHFPLCSESTTGLPSSWSGAQGTTLLFTMRMREESV